MTGLWRAAAWLFLGQGGVYALIGALTPFFMDRGIGGPSLFYSRRSDTRYFGDDPGTLMQDDPALGKYRTLLFLTIAGLLVALGLAVMAIAWFAVGRGESWGVWSLAVAGAMALVFWILVTSKYLAAGAPVGLRDVPPFMWVTTLLWAAGTAVGAFAMRA